MAFDPTPGVPDTLAKGLVRILAPNPSPMTFRGTNTYILGEKRVTIIDPGPDHEAHLVALIQAIDGRPVDQIVVTHSHLDHSPLAARLGHLTNASVLAFGDSQSGQSAIMKRLLQVTNLEGGEGVDDGFVPDRSVSDGELIDTDVGPLTVLHTPGHMGNHICLRWGDAVFSGDLVMGWSSSLVSPPDGDLTDFLNSCRRLLKVGPATLYPGHGDIVKDPSKVTQDLIDHRLKREAQVLYTLQGAMTPAEVTEAVYTDTPRHLWPAAQRNVLAHLIDLLARGRIESTTANQPLHALRIVSPTGK